MDRVGALIGPEGNVKSLIENETGIRMEVDSESGEVSMDTEKVRDPVMAMKVEDFIRAVGRGFSPHRAMSLVREEDTYLEVIDIRDYVGKSKKHLQRIKARIIGKKGKTRRLIEELTGALITVYGNTVAIIGSAQAMDVAVTGVDMILNGSEHGQVYSFLERKRRKQKQAQIDDVIYRTEEE
jgi:ribosomal RNA assembly protein